MCLLALASPFHLRRPTSVGGLAAAARPPAPDECFSVARYYSLRHAAVSFVSSDIRVVKGLVIVALCGVSAPPTDDKKSMRAQLAAAMTQLTQECYAGKPLLVVGDLNAAASPEDRGNVGKLLPYDKEGGALTNVLTRLSLTGVHKQTFPTPRHYTWRACLSVAGASVSATMVAATQISGSGAPEHGARPLAGLAQP